jgi:hypothetical protein
MNSTLRFLILVLICVVQYGCSSTTVLNSRPPGAKLYLNDDFKGTTPFEYSDTKIVGSTTSVKLTLEGYDDFHTTLHRDEQVNVGALIGGLFVLVPFLWIMDYDNQHTYELHKTQATTDTPELPELEAKLKSFKKMLDDGTITQDEYDTLRKHAIDSITK